jgi:hypothetical protein
MGQKLGIEKGIRHLLSLATAGIFTLGMTHSSKAQNLIVDPGFEPDGGTAPGGQTIAPNPNNAGAPGWANFNNGAFSTTFAHTGSWSFYAPGGAGGYTVPGTYQIFAASPGETFTLSGYVYTPNVLVASSNDFALLQISPFAGSPPNYGGATSGPAVGVDVGTPGAPAPASTVPLPQGVWTFASITDVMPAGTGSVGAYLLGINADANGTFYFDDITLTAVPVPEPVSASLIAVPLLAMAMRRRRA